MFSQTTILALTGLLSTVSAHGQISSPTPRAPGTAMASACGQQVYDNQASDSYGNVQGELQVAATQSDYNAAECDIWLCKGYKYADNTANVQSFTAGEVIPITVDIRAPHTGTCNVSIVATATNTMISAELIYFDVYASTATGVAANNTQFDITMPTDLGSQCDTAGACVIQWYWNAESIDQTYESCIDFTLGGSGSSNTTTAATSVAASSIVAASSVAASSVAASSVAASSVIAASSVAAVAATSAAVSSPIAAVSSTAADTDVVTITSSVTVSPLAASTSCVTTSSAVSAAAAVSSTVTGADDVVTISSTITVTASAASTSCASVSSASPVATSIISNLVGNAVTTSSTTALTTLQTSVLSTVATTSPSTTSTVSAAAATSSVDPMPAGTTWADLLSWLNTYVTDLMSGSN